MFFFFKQKTAYEMRISDWSSDVCSSDLRAGWGRFPDDVREWLEVQDWRSRMPGPGMLLVESFPHKRLCYSVFYTFEGWPANQSLGMLITRRMEECGLQPGGFVANDYALAVWGLKPVRDPDRKSGV